MNKAPFNIPNILASLANDVASGQLTLEQAAEELCRSHWTQFVDVKQTEHLLNPYIQQSSQKGSKYDHP